MILEILCIGALVAFWLSTFLQAFGVGSSNFDIVKWGWLCCLIGLFFAVHFWLLPLGDGSEIPDWQGYVFITLFFVSSLGSGYICGRRRRRCIR